MFTLVADFVVRIQCAGEVGCSYRLQKMMDIAGEKETYINVIPSSNSHHYLPNNFYNLTDEDILYQHPSLCHLYYQLVEDNKLRNLIPKFQQGKETSIRVVDMIARKENYILPQRYVSIKQYFEGSPYSNDDKMKEVTIMITTFIETFNSCGTQIASLSFGRDLFKVKDEVNALRDYVDFKTTKMATVDMVQGVKQSQESTMNTLSEKLSVSQVLIFKLTTENNYLKKEMITMKNMMSAMLLDIAYLKATSPMIEL